MRDWLSWANAVSLVLAFAVWGVILSFLGSNPLIHDLAAPTFARAPTYSALTLAREGDGGLAVIGDSLFQSTVVAPQNATRITINAWDINDLIDTLTVLATHSGATRPCRIVAQADPLFTIRMKHWGYTQIQHLPPRPKGTRAPSLDSIRGTFDFIRHWTGATRDIDPVLKDPARPTTLIGQARRPDPDHLNWQSLIAAINAAGVPVTLVPDERGSVDTGNLKAAFETLRTDQTVIWTTLDTTFSGCEG